MKRFIAFIIGGIMLISTSAYKTDIAAMYRDARIRGTITLTDNTVIDVTEADIFADSLYIDEQIVPGEDLALGGGVASEMGMRLKTSVSASALYGAKIDLDYQLLISEATGTVYSYAGPGVFDTSDNVVPSGIPATADFESTQYYEVEFTSGALEGNSYRAISAYDNSSWSSKDGFQLVGIATTDPDPGDTFIARTYEVVPLGIYYVNESKRSGQYVNIVAFDTMQWLDFQSSSSFLLAFSGINAKDVIYDVSSFQGFNYTARVYNSVGDSLDLVIEDAYNYYDYYGWNVNLTTNTSDALSVTIDATTLTINIKLANATASKNTSALIEAAIVALYSGTGNDMEKNIDEVVCYANDNWDTTSIATGEDDEVYFGGGSRFTSTSLTGQPNDSTTLSAVGENIDYYPYRQRVLECTRILGAYNRCDRYGNLEVLPFIHGDTLTNLFSNGSFTSTTGWTGQASSLSAASNILSDTADGTSVSPYVYQTTSKVAITGRKIYIRAKVRVTNSSCSSMSVGVYGATSGGGTTTMQASPAINTWYTYSVVITLTNQVGALKIEFIHTYPDLATASGKVMQVQYVTAIDLSEHYGVGNEPSAAYIDSLLNNYSSSTSWFDSTVRLDKMYKYTQLITNGDFDGVTTDWATTTATLTASSNTMAATGNGTNAAIAPYINLPAIIPGHTYFLKARVRIDDASCSLLSIRYDGVTAGTEIIVDSQSSPDSGAWYELSGVVTQTDQTGLGRMLVRANYSSSGVQNGKVMQVQWVSCVDLTQTYGLTEEPSAETIDNILLNEYPTNSWFDTSFTRVMTDRSIAKAERWSTDVADNPIQVSQLIANADGTQYTSGTAGQTLELPDFTVLKYLSSAAKQTMMDNILTEISKVKYYPFEIEFIGDPTLQPGDWIDILDTGNENDDPITMITHSTWRFRGRQTIRGVGIAYDYVKPVPQTTRDITSLRTDIQYTLEVIGTTSATWNVPSLAGQATSETDITVTGAALGDYAVVSCGVDSQSIMFTASVTATNTVTVVAFNPTASTTIDLASTTFKVTVLRTR